MNGYRERKKKCRNGKEEGTLSEGRVERKRGKENECVCIHNIKRRGNGGVACEEKRENIR